MNDKSIRKLRKKFIQVTMLSLIAAMFIMNMLFYAGTQLLNRHTIRNTLNYIIENDGLLENWSEELEEEEEEARTNRYLRVIEELFSIAGDFRSPEFSYSTRYFAVTFDSNKQIIETRTSYIQAVSDEEAVEFGEMALSKWAQFGRFGDYYYKTHYEEDGSGMVVFLDSRNTVNANNRTLYMVLMVTAFGIILAFFIARLIADHAIRSEIKNASIQKRFMTDISHELKTPLAVIRANTEMEEVLSGETEWTQSTLRQVDRMNGLIQSLVMISRAEEKQSQSSDDKVDLSGVLKETVQNFKAMALNSGRSLDEDIDEDIVLRADEGQMRQLCSLLMDNAVKYCDEEGIISATLKRKGRTAILEVSNTYAEGADVDCSRFFDRFYRQDDSHNIDRGGYGIGLSVAESIVERHRGSIDAEWKDGTITFRCQLKIFT